MLLFPDTYNGNAQNLLQAMQRAPVFIRSPAPARRRTARRGATYQLCGDKLTTNASRVCISPARFETHIDITQGCQPITPPMTITKAEDNLIYEINNQPALAVFASCSRGRWPKICGAR